MSAKKFNTKHIGTAIREMFERYSLTGKFDEAALLASWDQLVGKPVARNTRRLYIRDKVLFVQMDSAAMKHDLTYSKDSILRRLEDEFGKGLINEIVVI